MNSTEVFSKISASLNARKIRPPLKPPGKAICGEDTPRMMAPKPKYFTHKNWLVNSGFRGNFCTFGGTLTPNALHQKFSILNFLGGNPRDPGWDQNAAIGKISKQFIFSWSSGDRAVILKF
jgi:hypothetical protein